LAGLTEFFSLSLTGTFLAFLAVGIFFRRGEINRAIVPGRAEGGTMSISSVSSSESQSYWQDFLNTANGKKTQDNDPLSTLLSDLDADGDGVVSLRESGLDKETFDALDADRDGVVSPDELKEALKSQYNAMLTQMRLEMSENASASSSASGSDKSEAQKILADMFNGGSASLPANNGGNGQTSFDALDANQDGIVSAEELMAASQQPFGLAENGKNSAAPGLSREITDSLLALANYAYSSLSKAPAPEQTVSLRA
jgi:Ca2+-binding EF-hand superfamily protein